MKKFVAIGYFLFRSLGCLLAQDSIDYLKVNIHYILHPDSIENFSKEGSFNPKSDSIVNGYAYAERIINHNNHLLAHNKPMNLINSDSSNQNPPKINFRYLLTGVYYHRDSVLCYYDHNYPKIILKKYGVNSDTEFNIFFLQWPPDMPENKRKDGGVAGCLGCGQFPVILMVDAWDEYQSYGNLNWLGPVFSTVINHEMGHLLGLAHNWGRDGCDDTPEHKRAWCGHDPEKGIYVDNNMMSYNCNPSAMTSCQLEIVNKKIHNEHKNRFIRSPAGNPPPQALFAMNDDFTRNSAIILNGFWRSLKTEKAYRITIKKKKNSGKGYKKSKIGEWRTGAYNDVDLIKYFGKKIPKGEYELTLEVKGEGEFKISKTQEFSVIKSSKD